MPEIKVLDQATINQIAAGEVVDRPSSVVKELVENAVDAGATAITIEIRDGGISLIRVTDNGCGIPADQVKTAFLPHATSKIRTAEDLLSVSSLGFRGEALASIAAVAKVELITKTRESLGGTRYQIEGGQEIAFEEIGAPEGTTFLVRNLFFNTPARRNFLKSPATEGSYISTLAERLALSHPDISFRLIVNNQSKLHTSGNHKLKDMIYTIYGREIASCLLPIHHESEHITIDGFIGKPEVNRGNRTYENYFVNGRYVKSNILTGAIEHAYRGFVMQQKYPFAVFHMTIDSSQVDVNVHPNKMELRFRNEEGVYEAVRRCIRQALAGEELIPRHAFEEKEKTPAPAPEKERAPEPFEVKRREEPVRELSTFERIRRNQQNAALGNAMVRERQAAETPVQREKSALEDVLHDSSLAEFYAGKDKTSSQMMPEVKDEPPRGEMLHVDEQISSIIPAGTKESVAAVEVTDPRQMELFEDRLLTPQTRAEYRIIGQVFDTYWMFQYKDQLLFMDQHAAHEKVLFERNVKLFEQKEFTSQQLQPPRILTLNAREIEVLEEYRQELEAYGFSCEPFGGREYAVYAVPGNLLGLDMNELLDSIIDEKTDEDGSAKSTLIRDKLALMSCKAAVKGNHRLSTEEVNALLDELLTLENPYMCPHGRPTIITMTQYELEKKFQRVVNG